jgi:hypothetical protein
MGNDKRSSAIACDCRTAVNCMELKPVAQRGDNEIEDFLLLVLENETFSLKKDSKSKISQLHSAFSFIQLFSEITISFAYLASWIS